MSPGRRSIALACLFVVLGCATTVPDSDSTPPEVTLHYRYEGEDWITLTGTTRLEPDFDEPLYLWLAATDSGGLKSATIHAEGLLQCSGTPPLGQVNWSESNDDDDEADVGDPTVSSRNVITTFELSDICTGGSPTSGTIQIDGSAENYHGGTSATPTLTLGVD